MAATGAIKFDAIALTTVEANLITKSLTARAAFVDSRRGTTHGWTEGSGTIWSEETKTALAALVTSMERDMGDLHFSSTPNAPSKSTGIDLDPSGLGEHLDDQDAPSV